MAMEGAVSTSDQDVPQARLRPLTEEERGRHPWYQRDVPQVAVCGATKGCDGWLAAILADSGGNPRVLLIPGTHHKGQMGWWWAKRPPRRTKDDVAWYRSTHMAQVPLSGRPGRVKIQCPECFHFSKIVAPQSRSASA